MPDINEANGGRRRMHKRTIECDGYLRDDGLWEVEAWLRDTQNPSSSAPIVFAAN